MKKQVFLNGLPIDKVSLETIVPRLFNFLEKKDKKMNIVCYLNTDNVNLSFKNKLYSRIIKQSDLVYADGWGPVLAGRILGYHLPGRLTTADFFGDFCKRAQKSNRSLFLLGGREKINNLVVNNLKKKFKQLKIAGSYHGFLDKRISKKVILLINQKKPDFLIVGMGSPIQEKWLWENKEKLNVKVGWCVGGLFEYFAGTRLKCPRWLGDLGLEWLFRLLVEPKRLWKRYLIGIPRFLLIIIYLRLKMS